MTDFSPLDSALYESTPEKIAASLRYLRKADAVMAALMPLSANTQAPPAAVPIGRFVIKPGERVKSGVTPDWRGVIWADGEPTQNTALYAAPPAAVPADQEPLCVGPRNYYGSLEIRCKDGVPEWCVENYDGYHWEPCPRPVYDALLAAARGAK